MKNIFFDFHKHLSPNLLCKLSKRSTKLNNLTLSNQRKLCISVLGLDMENVAYPIQTHSNNVVDISSGGEYPDADGLITCNQSIILSIQVADCVPIFIYDFKTGCKGLIHSGWRGTANKIISKAIKLFIQKGSSQKDIKVLIGPSIRKCCYEVGEELVELFDPNCIQSIGSKFMLDISLQIKIDLKKLEIPESNIIDSSVCTYCNSECHSYRREKGVGRMIALLGETDV